MIFTWNRWIDVVVTVSPYIVGNLTQNNFPRDLGPDIIGQSSGLGVCLRTRDNIVEYAIIRIDAFAYFYWLVKQIGSFYRNPFRDSVHAILFGILSFLEHILTISYMFSTGPIVTRSLFKMYQYHRSAGELIIYYEGYPSSPCVR